MRRSPPPTAWCARLGPGLLTAAVASPGAEWLVTGTDARRPAAPRGGRRRRGRSGVVRRCGWHDDGGPYGAGGEGRRLIETLEIGWRHHRGRPASPGGPLPSGLICGLDAVRRRGIRRTSRPAHRSAYGTSCCRSSGVRRSVGSAPWAMAAGGGRCGLIRCSAQLLVATARGIGVQPPPRSEVPQAVRRNHLRPATICGQPGVGNYAGNRASLPAMRGAQAG